MKEASPRKRKMNYFIGIDVSRNKLDLAIRNKEGILFHKEIENHTTQINAQLAEFKKLEKFSMLKAVFCMEDSGYYVNHLLTVLRKHRTNIHLGNPVHIKNSLGLVRDKSDRMDAIRIANYAYRHHDELKYWEPRRKLIDQLSAFTTVRARMMTVMNMIKVPLKDQQGYADHAIHTKVVTSCSKSMGALREDLNELEKSMLALVKSDPKLSRYFEIICSIPYVGPVTAIQIIISTNEFLHINCPRKFACYCGVAPFKRESGEMTGKVNGKISKIGNRKLKSLLHICAVGGIRRKGEFRDYYLRRCDEGKAPMTIVNAIRNKLIRRIFSCIRHDRLYMRPSELEVLLNVEHPPSEPIRKRHKFANRTPGRSLI